LTPIELEEYLLDHIPLCRAMQISVVAISWESVTLSAPLAPNINHRMTLFGGSASALAILSAWSLVHTRLRSADLTARLVIQRNTMSYDRPITGSFTAHSYIAEPHGWSAFTRTFARKGRARIEVSSTLKYEGQSAGQFEGTFVALNIAGESAHS
jgi:thioesterase domain-containing protein